MLPYNTSPMNDFLKTKAAAIHLSSQVLQRLFTYYMPKRYVDGKRTFTLKYLQSLSEASQ